MSLEELKNLNEELDKLFGNLPKHYGFIAYVFDNSFDGQGTGFHKNADSGDAMVTIGRIAEVFRIDLSILAKAVK